MPTVKTQVTRCLDLLELLGGHGGALALGEIARRLELPKSATHRLLAQLLAAGWVVQDEATDFYRLSLRLALIGQRFLHRTGLPDVYQPLLEGLAARTEAFVRIAVVEGDSLTWVGQAQGARSGLIYMPELLAEVPLATTANGKAWLATLPEEEAFRLIIAQRAAGHERRGPRARVSFEEIRKELEATRKRGWGLAVEDAEPGVVAIAAGIRPGSPPGPVAGTISIAGPVARIPPERFEAIAALVVETARELGALWPVRQAPGFHLRQQQLPA
jgi:IclR family transcriptional regulator, acetate operon repressor